MPKPDTAAIAPAKTATLPTSQGESRMCASFAVPAAAAVSERRERNAGWVWPPTARIDLSGLGACF